MRKFFSFGLVGFVLLMCALPVTAADNQPVVDAISRGCLFAYYPTDGVIYLTIDFSRDRLFMAGADQVSVAPVFSPSPIPDNANDGVDEAVTLGKRCTVVDILLTDTATGKPLLATSIDVRNGMADDLRLVGLDLAGEYEVSYTLHGLPEPVTVRKPLLRQVFAWEGNTLGVTDEIYPPFEPVTVRGNDVSVVLRHHTMNGFGLWDTVETMGHDILDAPMTIRFTTPDGEGHWTNLTSAPDRAASTPQQAVFNATAASDQVTVRTRSSIEMDGCMKVEMTLLPGARPTGITGLWIDIPLKDSEVPLFHEVSDYMRKNFSGFTPTGEGVIWDATKSRRTAEWLNPFTSYIWLGAEERGLCWFAENDRGWITRKGDGATPLQEIVREGDRVTLRVHIVNMPVTIDAPHELVFGLQASPTKPMPEGWRANTTTMPGGSGPVNPWGGLHCGYKGPYHGDWRIVDKIVEAQKTGTFDEEWFRAYETEHNPPPAYGSWDWYESVKHFSTMRHRPAMTYQEEMIQSVLQPEWVTFQDQWRNAGTLGTEMSLYNQREWFTEDIFREEDTGGRWSNPSMYINHDASYRDYGCWYANEWFKRGVSAYWDNTFPKYTFNTRNSEAYIASDGRIQPAMVYWNERKYMVRVWNLLNQWRRNQPDHLEWSHHMTNALILPLNGWATVILDYELTAEAPFTPEWHRTEATGRQVGAYAYWLYTPTGRDNERMKTLLESDENANDRPDWGMKMVHEALRSGYTGGSALRKGGRVRSPELERIILDFGYQDPDTDVHNYWDGLPALSVDNDDVKWVVLARPDEQSLLLVLQSWRWEDTAALVTIDPAALGFAPGVSVTDVETGESLSVRDGVIAVPLPGPYGTRLVVVR